ncbi:dihydrolipoyl dehydrogenase family protein [Thermoleophilum album]|uniref:Dihydrolipoamide dehydrogenase n=1 Tax=Thermoleophilum album TaxID=29539 RepID=A0A1H6FK03_THEAL|nr:NAD(P)/FAD-dependent oxidoreductase [Thermoleophilum album]SEH10165.1 dihydrolipoamide dehydrogenase [Thermoleophilum album]
MERFDACVIGMGPGGEVAAGRLIDAGMRVVVCERDLIGGECGYWACIPSKTLLRVVEARAAAARVAGLDRPALDLGDAFSYRDWMIRGLDDSAQVAHYRERGAEVIKGEASLTGPGRVRAGDRELACRYVVVATGSDPVLPPIAGIRDVGAWTNKEATTTSELPDSLIVLGGGPVGVELAQLFARLEVEVTIVHSGEWLVSREDRAAGELVEHALADDGVRIVKRGRARSVRKTADGRIALRLADDRELRARQLLVATGRAPRVRGVGLERVGALGDQGAVSLDAHCRAAEDVWAVGDVTGVALFTHVAKYQARVAVADILGHGFQADYRAVPRVVFCDPELAAVGVSERVAAERGIDVVSATVELPTAIARPYTFERQPRGAMRLLADRASGELVGAWALAPLAGEWIHLAALAIGARLPVPRLLAALLPQFPTYVEAYVPALEELAAAIAR